MEKKNKYTPPKKLIFAILATDVVLFTLKDGVLLVRLIPVNIEPFFKNKSGLPGGLLKPRETAGDAALRNLEHKAKISVDKVYIEQLFTFSEIARDPRGRVVSVAYLALVPWESLSDEEKRDKPNSYWRPVGAIKKLAYDHNKILEAGLERFASKITYTTLIAKIMPREFTLTELENVYQSFVKKNIDKRNFRKKIIRLKLVKPLSKERRGLKQRPAKLYSFTSQKIITMEVL